MSSFASASRDLFVSRQDSSDPRLGDLIRPFEYQSGKSTVGGWILAGYPDDEGIRLNGGRLGAAEGPDAIRRALLRMTPSVTQPTGAATPLFDCGNLIVTGTTLSERHDAGAKQVHDVLKAGFRWIGLGGGHDYGFADGKGFLDHCKERGLKPLVINLDAHLDVRPSDKAPHSGTPFRRLLENHKGFDFLQIGIQSQCNSREHFQWCQDQGGQILTYDEIALSGAPPATAILRFLEPFLLKRRPIYLSVDMDAFSSAYAQGCSQSWPTGLEPLWVLPALQVLAERMDVLVAGFYEVAPPLDQDARTAKLAACLIHRLISATRS